MRLRLLVIAAACLGGAIATAAESPNYRDWLKLSGEHIDAKSFPAVSSETPRIVKTNVLNNVRWMLGDAPVHQPAARSSNDGNSAVRRQIRFGAGLSGDLLLPVNVERSNQVPLVILIGVTNSSPQKALATAGFAAFAFDQIGSGTRIDEAKKFYVEHPHWSLLGKRVADTRAALVALSALSFIDTNKIWLLGCDDGTSASLHVAALDSRVRGVVALGGFAPMRPSLSNRGVTMAAKSQLKYPIVPRLGAFVGNEDRIPYDFRELVDVIAPRPVLLFAPFNVTQVDASDLARLYEPMTHVQYRALNLANGFDASVQRLLLDELKRVASPTP